MPNDANDKLLIHVNVEISTTALQTIVAYAKKSAARNESGVLRVDPAETVSEVITRFLEEHNFDEYVEQLQKA